ncbi:hypothetical protein EXU85_09245 [Spirosoma sp. KCTC 42546]|uniref:hypothetical protein n=1 Tax=Spirosoma sp. KCTC 42546 TaxID=2520506 RepID=UPI00115A5BDC|nr:hypothetical protein [Spirosoma sp. KCTC 42546]QDK78780.1 hypothetical protein EXU85_09245 [Spirosoma sp. KCTC 42546]
MALSMFNSLESAKKRFNSLKKQLGNNAYKALGTQIAFENITEKDGVNSAIDGNGHFSHHPVEGCNHESRFIIIEQLP